MSKLKIMAAVGVSALMLAGGVASSAAAQPYGYYGQGRHSVDRMSKPYVDSLEWRINNAAQQGRISWRERRDLMVELRQIQPLAWRAQNGRATGWEVRRLQDGVTRIESATSRYASGYGRYERYGDRYERPY